MTKQIKVTSHVEEYDNQYQTPENYGADLDPQIKVLTLQLKDLRNQIKELKRELKMHIANCPYSSIKVKE